MNRDKKLVLVIVQENWSEVFPGDWAKTSWLVYENRAVTRKDEFGCSAQDAVTKESNFILNELLYQEILRLVEMVKIRDPHVEILDGEAWGIKQFDKNGLAWTRELGHIAGKDFRRLASIMVKIKSPSKRHRSGYLFL